MRKKMQPVWKQLQGWYLIAMMFLGLPFYCVAQAAAAEEVTLNLNVGEEIRFLDPQVSTGNTSAHISINLWEGLYEYGAKTSDPEADLAESYTVNEDFSVYTFKLRKDASWVSWGKDGKIKKERPVTAQDFVFSYRRMLSPELASEYSYMLYVIKNGEKFNNGIIKDPKELGVEALDDYTLKITLEGSIPSFIQYLPHHAFHVVPKEPITAHKENWILTQNVWSSGPFILKAWDLKDKITIVKNPFYRDAAKVQLDKAVYKFIGIYSPESVRAVRAGELDVDLCPPPTSEITKLHKEGLLKASKQLGVYSFKINTTKKPLNDPRVRMALALTVPRNDIVSYVMKAGQIPTYSLVPDVFQGNGKDKEADGGYKAQNFIDPKTPLPQQYALAKKLLAEAGYPNGKGFPVFSYLYNTAENHQKVAVVLSKAWKQHLGIEIKPINQEWKVYLANMKNLDFDIGRAGWVADMADPMNFLDLFITDGGNNQTGWSNKEYDQLVRGARIERDAKKRNQMMMQAEAIVMKEMPNIPVFNYTTLILVQPYVSGMYANKMDQHSLKFVHINVAQKKKLFNK